MRPHDHPTPLAPDEQLRELARVLAAGLLRLRRPLRPADSGPHPGPKNPPDSSPNPLELSGETRLSGHTG